MAAQWKKYPNASYAKLYGCECTAERQRGVLPEWRAIVKAGSRTWFSLCDTEGEAKAAAKRLAWACAIERSIRGRDDVPALKKMVAP